ncbi:MAG: peptidase S10 [Asticcacaulis sp.]|uniref:S10 family peptidase n=1 Tax=Asticcacaulis sp. TaxID=1872648 RepID=UPI0039E2714A
MKPTFVTAAALLALLTAAPAFSAETPPEKPATSAEPVWPADSTTRHQITVDGRVIAYQATAGILALTDKTGADSGKMFYVAYIADRPKGSAPRPITFVYNGGPGSSSIWLHMGSFGPRYVRTRFPEPTPPASYTLADNPNTLLDKTDLVFLDAMNTGYSKPANADTLKGFMGIDQDADGFARAIRRYIEVNDRWSSPKFLMGESYGTTRSALLAYRLQADNIDLNGITLISSILNFGDLAPGLDRGTVNLLPTFAAIAHYHHRASEGADLDSFLAEVKAYADGPYSAALAKGHNISDAEKTAVAEQVSRYTGLSVAYLKQVNLRIEAGRFRSELLRDQGQIVGELDGRALGAVTDGAADRAEFDPAESASPSYVASFHDYLTGELKYRADMPYNAIDDHMFEVWDWSHQPPAGDKQISMADVALDLAAAMRRNPNLKVLSLNGTYDLITPLHATEYDLAHMNLPASLVGNVQILSYPSGHMIYQDPGSQAKMKADIARFYDQALIK